MENFVSFSIIFLSLCTFGENRVKPWPVNISQGKRRRRKRTCRADGKLRRILKEIHFFIS